MSSTMRRSWGNLYLIFEEENKAFADIKWANGVETKAKTYTYVSKQLYMFQTGNPNSTTTQIMNGVYDGNI